jgi:hypothetical protein
MINLRLPHWQRRVAGSTVFLIAPEGPASGVVTLTERSRPVVSLAALMAGRGEVVDGPFRLTNEEGEDGAFVSLRDGSIQHDIGVLVGDEFLATVIGVTAEPVQHARSRREVEALVRRFPLLLGVRRRLYQYPPPPGWHAVSRGLEAEYYAPDFPRDPSRLTLFPALPTESATAADALETLRGEQSSQSAAFGDDAWGESLRETPGGLAFQCATATAGERLVCFAAADDEKYLYAMRLEGTTAANHHPVLDAVLDGVVPITVGVPPTLSALAHWAE